MVYEVRGVWEESAVSSGDFGRGDGRYRRWRAAEDRAMALGEALVCICDSLRKEMVGRGVPESKVFVVPNGVDEDLVRTGIVGGSADPNASEAVSELRTRLRPFVVGYIGSVRRMEGVGDLIRAGAGLARQGRDISVLILGGGEVPILEELASDLGIRDRVVFVEPVDHERIAAYYSLIDAFVISRPDEPVARMVTPLKPLEAMALGTPVICSDQPALAEVVGGGKHPLLLRKRLAGQLRQVASCTCAVSGPLRAIQVADGLSLLRVPHHDHPPGLHVPTAGRPGGRLQYPMQHVLGQGVWFQPPDRSQRAHGFVDIHAHISLPSTFAVLALNHIRTSDPAGYHPPCSTASRIPLP